MLRGGREYLKDYLRASWKEYYNPEVYKDADIARPYEIQQIAYSASAQKDHRREVSSACVAYLLDNEMIDQEPEYDN